MSNQRFPISAVLPVYNCRERLERHLKSVVNWAPMVTELIVVDSGSTDGTWELVKDILGPLGAHFIQHPPSLYQSWNAGIAVATSPWCYISTVEDPITHEGLSHLLEVAERHNPDVVISPPEMMNEDGSAPSDRLMPGNSLQKAFAQAGVNERQLTRTETVMMLCGFIPSGLLGSSASNLYRSSFLQKHPFPTDYGHCGDTAWGVSVAPFVNIAFTIRICARFYCQGNWSAKTPSHHIALHKRLADLCHKSLDAHLPVNSENSVIKGWFDFHEHSMDFLWTWINSEFARRTHLEKKYAGGITGYLPRLIQDELKKFRMKK